jgi:dihydroorotate dehydrogenase (NAD+) catalytic subunit
VKPDLSVTIAGVTFANPLMTASGCCGYGEELSELFPLSRLGALVTKSITLNPRLGHPPPRTAETASGMLNAIGLANVGVDAFIADKLPFLEKQKTRIIVNVAGSKASEYIEVCRRLNDCPRADMIELNISCPNVDEGGIEIGTNPAMTERIVADVRKVFSRPLIAKLTPNVTDVTTVARAAEAGGADALSLINTLVGTSIDINTWRPRLTNNKGGLSGPAIKPVALAMVDKVHNCTKLPLIGIGGIANASDVIEFLLVGATAVQIGTELFVRPDAPVQMAEDLKTYMRGKKLSSISELVGKVRKY